MTYNPRCYCPSCGSLLERMAPDTEFYRCPECNRWWVVYKDKYGEISSVTLLDVLVLQNIIEGERGG